MLIKIKRQDCLNKYPIFPLRWYNEETEDLDYSYPKVYHSYILTLPSKTFRGHSSLLAKEITRLTAALKVDSLVFLGDMPTPWRYQDSDYNPVREALQFLIDNKIGKRFNGALQVDRSDLTAFIKHLSWLSRCHAALPYFYFTDTDQKILGTICHYGNLHLDTAEKKSDEWFKEAAAHTKLEFLVDRMCYEQFSASGSIKGRAIVL